MKTIALHSVILLLSLNGAQAQDVIKLWEGQTKPYYKENTLVEREQTEWGTLCVADVTDPTLTVYQAKGKNTGVGVIIIPGGNYSVVAIQHEGTDVAKALADQGITAGVLKYRLPNPKSSDQPGRVPLADDDMCMATPALVGDRLLIRTAARLYCIRKGHA